MADERQEAQPTQKTQPKKGKPVEIPVPKRGDFEKVLRRLVPDGKSGQSGGKGR